MFRCGEWKSGRVDAQSELKQKKTGCPSGQDPLVMTFTVCKLENHHAINGKIHYFYGHSP